LFCVILFNADRDRPHEAEQLAADGGHDLGVGLPLGLQGGVAPVQAVLCLPSDLVQMGREPTLART
jgi:hypothetical protein